MLSKEENELLCRVGSGTPMGTLMREYWIPALLSSELPERDGAPMRVRLLGEDLVAFRDSSGRVGLLAHSCPHRGASLFFGRNEEDGLRCVYHGWKFDASGACVDMPSEPPESNFKSKVRATAYPCQERGGLVWTYMGPREVPPPLPELEWNLDDDNPAWFLLYQRECNWLQALEGDIDTVHVNFLHSRLRPTADRPARSSEPGAVVMAKYIRGTPHLVTVDTDYGLMYGARRVAEADSYYWRFSQFMFPFYTMPAGSATAVEGKIWLPMDDEHTLVLEHRWLPRGISTEERASLVSLRVPDGFLPPSTDWLARGRVAANSSNEFLLDRELMRTSLYLGIRGNPTQDAAVQWGMGTVFDRSREHLGTTDAAIIRVRRRLLEITRALQDRGATPPGVDAPSLYRGVRNGWALLPRDADWQRAAIPATA
jgi:phenylpropionate dioxygenase-like ring-hydroxylating dioxygenase large terminal subunit